MTCRNILEVGCGTGYVTKRLARIYPQAQITAIDIAPAILEVARERLVDVSNVTLAEQDVETISEDLLESLSV